MGSGPAGSESAAPTSTPGAVGRGAVRIVARRRQGQLEQQRVTHELLEVDLVALDRVGVAVERVRLEQLAHADVEVGGELPEAGAALALPAGVQLTPGDDAVGHPLEHEIEAHRLDDAGDGRAEVGDAPPRGGPDGARRDG